MISACIELAVCHALISADHFQRNLVRINPRSGAEQSRQRVIAEKI